MSSRIYRGFTLATLALVLAACSSVPLDESQGTGAGTDARGTGDSGTGVVMDPFDPASPLSQDRSVYFDFDSYEVADQYRDLVEMHSSYLRDQPEQQVRIEGHADERGGTEYNLALGQRRSEARSEEHTSELQSRGHLVCRLLLEKKKRNKSGQYQQTE